MMQDEDLGGPGRKNVFTQGIIKISQVRLILISNRLNKLFI